MKSLETLQRVQRVTLAIYGAIAGALSLLTVLLPNWVAHLVTGRAVANAAILYSQREAGARLGLAMVALIAAWMPRPPRALVWAMFAALAAGVIGPILSKLAIALPLADLQPFNKLLVFDGAVALVLLVTQELRAAIVRKARA
ncbi:MAG TPA: hypothetical protein VFF06_23135 [Polyangia bacterium]|nr:hypothetical protein [Polyangia bacterium]